MVARVCLSAGALAFEGPDLAFNYNLRISKFSFGFNVEGSAFLSNVAFCIFYVLTVTLTQTL